MSLWGGVGMTLGLFLFLFVLCYVAQAALELAVFLPQLPGRWDCSPPVILKCNQS